MERKDDLLSDQTLAGMLVDRFGASDRSPRESKKVQSRLG